MNQLIDLKSMTLLLFLYKGWQITVDGCVFCEEKIFQDVFVNYTPQIRPARMVNESVHLLLSFSLFSLHDINEKKQSMQAMSYLSVKWTDKRLTWLPNNYDGTDHIIIPTELLWVPDIRLLNSANTYLQYEFRRDFLSEVSYSGGIKWNFGGIFETSCDIEMRYYPFDSQSCEIIIESWRYAFPEVDIEVSSNIFIYDAVHNHALWKLVGFKAIGKLNQISDTVKYARASITLNWERKPMFFYINIIIPAAMLIVVSLGVFWLPPNCGEKVSLAITVLLSFSVFLTIIMDRTPANSNSIPIITQFFLMMMSITTISLITAISVIYIDGLASVRRAPEWLRNLCFSYLLKLTRASVSVGLSKPPSTSNEIEKNPGNNNYEETIWEKHARVDATGEIVQVKSDKLLQICQHVGKILQRIEAKGSTVEVKEEWTNIGRVIDRTLFLLCSILLIIFLLYIFIRPVLV